MSVIELTVLAVGLSMDAFAVAVCSGLSMRKINFRKVVVVGLYFGIFQGVMPLIGYFLGSSLADKITSIDHWIAFVLLGVIGGKMLKDSFDKEECTEEEEISLEFKKMLPLAVATSIDALAVGVSFAFLKVRIIPAVTSIGVITFILSAIGVKVGNVFGAKYKSKAELVGGIILILIGTKILLEHLGFM